MSVIAWVGLVAGVVCAMLASWTMFKRGEKTGGVWALVSMVQTITAAVVAWK